MFRIVLKLAKICANGVTISSSDPGLFKIKTRNIITYSIKNKNADVFIYDIVRKSSKTIFKLNIKNKNITHLNKYKFTINAIGSHNVLNGTASIIASKLVGFCGRS